ncbi:MAG: shikimate dehydrogenase family protein, partial [Bacteroidia bacterium]
MKKYGVIGYPVLQSFSPKYFEEKFRRLGLDDFSYEAIEVKDISTIRDLIYQGQWDGLNVTIPHKQQIIPFLDGISHLAVKLNAVNTIKVEGQKLIGYNTDYYGFSTSLTRIMRSGHSSALIFGTGGSSLAVRFALRKLGIDYLLVSRGEA